ncbi:protein-tyrosine-phosphatase [Malassezia sp. CBS 17886]|nr:protein-tyrosine-phosphatase [Malassezia sp. CBS 17886]
MEPSVDAWVAAAGMQLAALDDEDAQHIRNRTRVFDVALSQGHRCPHVNRYVNVLPCADPGTVACVASQAPTPPTFPAFFHHLVAQKVSVLVNLTPLQEGCLCKSDQYWPTNADEPLCLPDGSWSVTETGVKFAVPTMPDLAVRGLRLASPSIAAPHDLVQIHYTGWRDHGPLDPSRVLALLRMIDDAHAGGPLWVHCSAGIGRSGTLIGAFLVRQSSWRAAAPQPPMELAAAAVKHMRRFRPGMVQTVGQLITLAATIKMLPSSHRGA